MTNLIKGAPLRDALQAGQRDFFDGIPRQPQVAFLVPLGKTGLEAYDTATERFASGQRTYGAKVGVRVTIERRSQQDMLGLLRRLGADALVQGVVMGEPLPDSSRLAEYRQAIPESKDIDGANPSSPYNLRRPTPSAMVHVARSQGIDVQRVRSAVVGSQGAIGSSLMAMLHDMGARPYGIDRHNSDDLQDVVADSDVVFTVANQRNLITCDMLTDPSKLIIDAAIIPVELPGSRSGIVGNVDPAAYDDARVRSSITPVPGGVGVLNTAMVFANLEDVLQRVGAAA